MFSLPYMVVIAFSSYAERRPREWQAGIWAVRPDERNPMDDRLPDWERVTSTFLFRWLHRPFASSRFWWLWGIPSRVISTLFTGLYFSILSAFHIGWRDMNVGSWISRMQFHEYNLRGKGFVRFLSGLQSLTSVYLWSLALLTYFGSPFE